MLGTARGRADDYGIGSLRWGLGELAGAVAMLIAADMAVTYAVPRRRRRHRLRSAVIAGAAMAAIATACGAGAAAAAFHSPARVLSGVAHHSHVRKRRDARPYWTP